jgi:cyclopropane-fatty-acyl-phospholipid synthase
MNPGPTALADLPRTAAPLSERPAAAAAAPRAANAVERGLLRWLLRALGSPPVRFVLWNGEEIGVSQEPVRLKVQIRDPGALRRLALDPDLNFGEDYTAARIDVQGSLVDFLETLYRVAGRAARPAGLQRLVQALRNGRRHRNTLDGSRENIHRHYDLGNDFYALWLDREMVYTCAYFASAAMSLEDAQVAKMEHVCRKLELKPGQRVVEAGCGWGALARHMAAHFGVTVKAYNISHEQVALARERTRLDGLQDRVEYVEDDYRNIRGQFDAFVSVGMLEHVGVENYEALGAVALDALKENGRGLIHTIGRNRAGTMNAWIERHIFPGAHPPCLSEMMQIFEPHNFSVLDVENLRLHYARTLAHWLERFESRAGDIEAMTDASFVRAWRLYLAGSLASFAAGDLQLFQVVFAKGACNDVPWTRRPLYSDTRDDAKTWTRVTS